MADSAVSFLLQNLSRLLVDEVKLISGVEDQIRSLSNEFKFIDIFLKSSEGKRSNEFVKELVNQIRDAAHKVEDVVDTYVAEATVQRRRNKLSKLVHYPSHVMMLHDVDAEIGRIKRSIDEIYMSKERYNIGEGEFPSEDDAEESLRKRRRDVEEKEVVGLVQDTTFVINQLKETTSRRDAVSIIGMGGLGKTTLARKIYNNKEVHELFPYRAWGYVSNDYRVKELLLSLLKCLLSTSEYHDLFRKRNDEIIVSENEEEMKKEVKRSLRGKKYLVVLDDIWRTEVWDDIEKVFPDDKKSSRILITSRHNEVAFYTGTTPPYYLPFLNKEEGWALFSKKVFHGEDCPSNLKDIGTSIVEGCGGLPLAIVVLAGLVAKKDKSPREWLQIKDQVRWRLAEEDILMDILKLSFNSLPRRLKSCFLYFGIYPEDYKISARQLIQLWMAEGFLQPSKNAPKQEDLGDNYLNELVDRSLVQVTSHRSDGGVKTCQIHDLLRDLCISESNANEFIAVSTELVLDKCNARRMSVHFKNRLLLSLTQDNQSHTLPKPKQNTKKAEKKKTHSSLSHTHPNVNPTMASCRYELELKLSSARNLKNVNWRHGPNRPYAVVWVDPNNKCSSRVDESGDTEANWDQTLVIPLPPEPLEDLTLHIDVVHAGSEDDTKPLIGSARLKLAEVLNDVGIGEHASKTLTLKRPSGRPHGKVDVKVTIREPGYRAQGGYYAPPYGVAPPPPASSRDYAPPSGYGYPYGAPPVQGSYYSQPQAGYPYGGGYNAPPQTAGYGYGAAPQTAGYGYGAAPVVEEKKKSKFGGMGTGLAVGALAGAVGGIALVEGAEYLEDKITDDVAEKVEDDLGYDDGGYDGDDF